MAQPIVFGEVLDAIDKLTVEEQLEMIAIVQRRLIDLERKRIVADVRETRKDFAAGRCNAGTVTKLMKELNS